MLKILNSNNRNFDRELERLLSNRKNKVKSSSVSVTRIIEDVKEKLKSHLTSLFKMQLV